MSGIIEEIREMLSTGSYMNNYVPAILAAIIGFILILLFYILKNKHSGRKDFLIMGLCESGKTSIFMHLIHNKLSRTFTSIKENVGEYKSGRLSARLVDIPGHYRVRDKCFEQYKTLAKGIIFVIDSSTVQKDVRDVADALYTVLADSSTAPCSILLACNKQDITTAKGVHIIKTILEKEMNLVRDTRSRKLKSISEDDESKTAFLGAHGKDFEFSQLPQNVQIFGCSSKKNDLNNVSDWLDRML